MRENSSRKFRFVFEYGKVGWDSEVEVVRVSSSCRVIVLLSCRLIEFVVEF